MFTETTCFPVRGLKALGWVVSTHVSSGGSLRLAFWYLTARALSFLLNCDHVHDGKETGVEANEEMLGGSRSSCTRASTRWASRKALCFQPIPTLRLCRFPSFLSMGFSNLRLLCLDKLVPNV